MKRSCRVCGAEYEYCYSCEKVRSWRALSDTLDHYYILNVLMDYQTDHDAMKAYNALSKRGVNVKETDVFLPSVKSLLVEISSVAQSESEVENETFSSDEEVAAKKIEIRVSPENSADGNAQE